MNITNLKKNKTLTNPLEHFDKYTNIKLQNDSKEDKFTISTKHAFDDTSKDTQFSNISLVNNIENLTLKENEILLKKISSLFKCEYEEFIFIDKCSLSLAYKDEYAYSHKNLYFVITDYRIVLYSEHITINTDEFSFPISYITSISNEYKLKLLLKDLRYFKFIFDNTAISNKVSNEIKKILYPSLSHDIYAYKYFKRKKLLNDGWKIFNFHNELIRQEFYGSVMSSNKHMPSFINNRNYILSLVNESYLLSPTYPIALILAYGFDDKKLNDISKLFMMHRLPIMSYFNKNTNNSLWISASFKQNLVYNKDIISDTELYISSISSNKSKLVIFEINIDNKASQISFGGNDKIVFNFENISKVKVYFNKLYMLHKEIKSAKAYSIIEQTNWLILLSNILKMTYDVINSIKVSNIIFIQ